MDKFFKVTNVPGRADFGNLGAQDGGGQYTSGGEGQYDIDAETEVGNTGQTAGERERGEKKSEDSKSDLLSTVTGAAGLFGGMGNLCACADKDKAAENAKKEELAKKYPLRDCGPTPTQECLNFNKKQQALRDQDFEAWQKMKDAEVAENMAPSDAARFQFVAALAQKLKAKHPEAGNMTLSQIYKTYPEDFDAAYAELQAQFPFLKNIDAATALAMNPGVAGMTLDQLIAKTTAISGMSGSSGGGIGAGTAAAGIGIIAALGIGFMLLTRRK